ncbi:MAG: bifunctional (p)ppGpp synthetase/guanosine-3',5'-bis(diphosphate) 3'-pyrophosphohydrolase [Holosporaceae bacterium]|nr:bifunctional (p)ppGpp synthetase/guanosine-3',5'-bis(diphosphate) 3'-pyrophosphohydrolase [Holosporaceae bacterium]
MITSSELIALVKDRNANVNEDLLRKAYIFAMEAHGIQKRASGAPYFSHSAEVARILAELGMDVLTIVTALLHDVLEDSNVSHEELEEIFGSEVAFLVEGVTKLSRINYTSSKVQQVENFRKLLLAISCDIRVLIVKLADRLHNMRTLNYIASIEKRKKIALESLEIYAPLAERIGMNLIKDEIEDIAFYTIYSSEYHAIATRLEEIRSKDNDFIQNTILELQRVLLEAGIRAEISGREKKVYSIWKKMQKRNVSLEQINDIIAFRIIVKTVEQCYLVLGVVHSNFRIVPGKFKDYISIPKLNNYRSLHTIVIGPSKQPVEIQIRTEEMHKIADEGIAAHWSYKNGDVVAKEEESLKWVENLLNILQSRKNPEEVMSNSKLEMFEEEVFCFTPEGDLISLPRGATAVDFAYEIHTAIGNTCIGARINGKMSPLKTVLRNGDRVDIITSLYQSPEAAWEKFVVTGKAKACIRRFVKTREKFEFVSLGLQLVKYVFAMTEFSFNENLLNYKKFACSSLNKFYHNVGRGDIPLSAVRALLPDGETQLGMSEESVRLLDFVPGIVLHFADCCYPILGDKIIGIIASGKGMIVHLANCNQIEEGVGPLIRVKWDNNEEADAAFIARLRIVVLNKPESFAIITNIISLGGASITNIKIEHRSIDFFDLLVDIKINNTIHLEELEASLRICLNVRSIRRL